jgi:arginyl-tRNA synthetase
VANYHFNENEINVEIPKNQKFGDYTSGCAFSIAKNNNTTPDLVASTYKKISAQIPSSFIVNAQGPYPNAFIKNEVLWAEILKIDNQYGRNSLGKGSLILLEFVSANPTGPLHIGHGRWAALGDSLGRILEASGYRLTREFFINDLGGQVEMLAKSVAAVKEGKEIPPDGYHGQYLQELAQKVKSKDLEKIKRESISLLLAEQKKVLEKFRVKFDSWFSEEKLHQSEEIKQTLSLLKESGHTYEKDGALWFKSTDFGDDKDRVLERGDGRPTYFLSDIAYHWDKIKRGFNQLVNIWGADHHGYVPRLSAAVGCLPAEKKPGLKIIIGQLVSLFRSGEPVRMSKRTGDMITLEEVLDEIGVDAARYLLVRTSANTHLDFDLDLAKKHSDDNPVYYVQYAHARICSIFEKQKEKNIFPSEVPADVKYEFNQWERDLMKKLISWPDELEVAAKNLEPQRLPRFAEELATVFHVFYHNCCVLDAHQPEQTAVRLQLSRATKNVLAFIFNLLGVEAPVRM